MHTLTLFLSLDRERKQRKLTLSPKGRGNRKTLPSLRRGEEIREKVLSLL